MKHRFLVTGATGFVGSWITHSLVERGEDVSVIVRNKRLNPNSRLHDIADKIKVYEGDLLSSSIEKTVAEIKPTIVFHLAAYGALPAQQIDTDMLLDTNVKGVIRLINAAKKYNLKLFINTGSSSEYGIKDKPMRESDLLEPVNDYGVTKAAATLYVQKIAKREELPLITFRLFSPYGAKDDEKRLIPYVISQALQEKPLELNSGENVRDFVYIADVVQAYLQAIDKKFIPGEIFNIGSGQQHSVYDIVTSVVAITKSASSLKWGAISAHSRQVEPKMWQADISKAKKSLNWKPKYSLKKGLQETIKESKKE